MYMTVKEVIEKIDALKKSREHTRKMLKITVEKDYPGYTDRVNEKIKMIDHDIKKLEESRVLINGRFYLQK